MPTKLPFRVHEKRLAVGISKRFFGHSIRGISKDIVSPSSDIDAHDGTVLAEETIDVEGTGQAIDVDMPISENDDPLKRRVQSPQQLTGMARKVQRFATMPRRIFHMFRPPLTPEEELQQEEERRARQFEKVMYADAITIAKRLSNKLTKLGFAQEVVRGKSRRIKQIQFDKISWDRFGNEIVLHVDDSNLPAGVWTTRLGTDEVATECRISIGHPVTFKADTHGTCIHVDRAGTMGLPNVVMFRDILPLRPASSLPLTFYAGTRSNGGREWRSLEAIYHFIGAGTSGGGKSTYMHQMLCTFISYNTPEDVLLMLVDLKFGGVALTRYEGCPHLITRAQLPEHLSESVKEQYPVTGVATDLATADAVLNFALREVERRGEMFLSDKKFRPQKIEDWNKHHTKRHLPRIVIIIDELAEAMDKSSVSDKQELALINSCRYNIRKLLKLARSSGVHLVTFTQSLDKTVMGVVFKTNIGGRICFSVPDFTSSILVIGDGDATNLSPAGRGVFKHGPDKFLCQTPLITEADINQIVEKVKKGERVSHVSANEVSPEDIIRYAVLELNGMFSQRSLEVHFSAQIEVAALRKILQGMDDRDFQVDEFTYHVFPGGPRRARHVERIEK
jgi:DNA segregation ATPase FtsK/SpoIIIE-like protein